MLKGEGVDEVWQGGGSGLKFHGVTFLNLVYLSNKTRIISFYLFADSILFYVQLHNMWHYAREEGVSQMWPGRAGGSKSYEIRVISGGPLIRNLNRYIYNVYNSWNYI